MTKHMEVHKPMTEGCEQVEEGTTTSGKDARTVRKPTEKSPDTQNVFLGLYSLNTERVTDQ